MMTADEIWNYINLIHKDKSTTHNHDFIMRLEQYPQYHLKLIPLKDCKHNWRVDQDKVKKYKDLLLAAPPIVVWKKGKSFDIVDGTHRYEVSKLKGETHILAWVGVKDD